jgi:hypothetical protein
MSRQVFAVAVAVACTLACRAGRAPDGALALIQKSAEKKHAQKKHEGKKRIALPDADSVLQKPEGVLKLVNSRVGDLQKQLELIQARNQEALKRERDDFELRLRAQKADNVQVAESNHLIEQEIESIKKQNSDLRQHTADLSVRSHAQLAHARELQVNVSSADEFIKNTLALQ